MQNRVPAIIVVALALMTGVWLWFEVSQHPSPDNGATGQRLFPELEQQLNDINRIIVEHNGNIYEVARTGDQWQLPDKGGYPVLFERVKSLLLGISLLEKVEPKTGKPENHVRLGVQSPAADSDNMRIGLYTGGDNAIASLIIGKMRGGLIAGGKDGIFVRVSGESRAWLVAGKLYLPQDQIDWTDRQIIHIKPKAVKRVTISHPDGTGLRVEKQRRSAVNFSLMNKPEGRELENPEEINLLARGLTALKMQDVNTRLPADPPETESVTTIFSTWDGLEIKVTTVAHNDQIWAWFDLLKPGTSDTDDLQTRLSGWIFRLSPSSTARLRGMFD